MYRVLAESIPQQVWTARVDGSLDYVNPVVVEYFGMPSASILGSGWLGLVHPDDVASTAARWLQSLESGEGYEVEFRLRRHDGAFRWHLGRAVPQHDTDGTVIRWFGTNTDIDDRRVMEAALRANQDALRESARRFEAFAEAMPLIAWSMSADGSDVYINPRWDEYTGQSSEMAFEERWRRALHPDDFADCFASWARAGEAKVMWQSEYRLRRHDGAYRWHLGRSVPDLDDRGEVVRWYGTATDIHTQRVAIRSREDLLATVSHDLRDPLGTIALASATLRESAIDPAARASADVIDRAVLRMERLLGDLLDIASIENGQLAISCAVHGVAALLADAAAAIASRAAKRGVLVRVSPVPEGLKADCDRGRVLQVLGNLLGNAVKFTPPGGAIDLAADREAELVQFEVRDTGAGIGEDHLPFVFERFWKSRDRQRAGTGLGLAISRGIVEQHGGRIWVESRPGAGSTFRFTVPAA